MIPEKLVIKGIYSYKNRTKINFDSLTESGLFGIFGSVGSGKSTILEAITYVLYGETERLNNRDAKVYNMMNLRSDEMEIDFVFRQYTDRYRFMAFAKRSSKQFDTITRNERKAYKWDGNEWIPLESADATHVTGLKYNHFKQIVIIPQGKFNEFIQLSAQQRTDMLKELFPQMERFDFKHSLQPMLSEVKSKISTLEGQLNELEEYKPEMIEDIKKEIEQKRLSLAQVVAELEQRTASLNKLNEIKKLVSELNQTSEKHSLLLKQKEHVEQKETDLLQYETYVRLYQPMLQRLLELENSKVQLEQNRDEMKAENDKIETLLEQNGAQCEEIIQHGGNIDTQKNRVTALEKAIHVVAVQEELAKCQQQLSTDSAAFISEEKARAKLQNEVDVEKENLRKLKSELPDEDALHQLLNNYKDEERIRERRVQVQSELDSNNKLVEKLTDDKLEIIHGMPIDVLPHKAAEMSTNKLVEGLHNCITMLKDELMQLRLRETTLIEQDGLARYANTLLDTEPCPLCGSLHHPEPFTGDGYRKELGEVKKKIVSMEEAIEKTNTAVTRLNMLIETFKTEQDRKKQRMVEFDTINQALQRNLDERKSISVEYSHEELKLVYNNLKNAKRKILDFEKALGQKENLLRDAKKMDDLKESLQNTKTHIASLQATISVQLDQIDHLWLSKTGAELSKMKKVAVHNIKRLDELNTQIDKGRLELQRISAGVEALNKQLVAIVEQKDLKNKELLQQLAKDHIDDVETVKLVLAHKMDVHKERLEIGNYRQELYATQQRFNDLQTRLGKQTFDTEQIAALIKQIDQTEKSKSLLENTIGALDNRLQTLQNKLLIKQGYLSQFENSTRRKENLDVLSTLFRGDGFVRFVSQIYLEQLCSFANERFKVLTNNQLELEVDEKQQFVVRDFLNEGRTRLLKTLSGGQTFQAAFSLAMALSEQIQQHQHVNQQFFFMDEGFGALDKESLSVVFETLKQLRHENRTVGIISHVEDLQTEIDRFIYVKKDSDSGSSISMVV